MHTHKLTQCRRVGRFPRIRSKDNLTDEQRLSDFVVNLIKPVMFFQRFLRIAGSLGMLVCDDNRWSAQYFVITYQLLCFTVWHVAVQSGSRPKAVSRLGRSAGGTLRARGILGTLSVLGALWARSGLGGHSGVAQGILETGTLGILKAQRALSRLRRSPGLAA